MARDRWGRVALVATALAAVCAAAPAGAQASAISVAEGVHAGEVAVPVNKSQVIRSDRPYAKALIGNPEVADVLPLTDQSLYVLGKKMGTTSLTLYDRSNMLIAVVDVVVGPDVISLRRQLSELMPAEGVGARISNDSIVLEGVVPDAVAADRAVQIAETYAPGKVVNMLSLGSAQQVMLEVRFSEIKRSALKQLGVGGFLSGSGNNNFQGVIGGGASLTPGGVTTTTVTDPVTGVITQNTSQGAPVLRLGSIVDSFGILGRTFHILGLDIDATLDALERKGAVNTLAEPTLVALSGETASFLAGGEFPVPVVQNAGGGGAAGGGGTNAFTVEWKPFGVSLAFTPTVLADGVINLVVAPEVSSIDPSASIVINNLTIPGVQTRRAKTTVELRDGESFALAGLIRNDFQDTVRQFPILGSLPIIGSLFRSTGFQREETELVMIVTPRLVRPVRAGGVKAPTDRVQQPNEADLFLLGRTDTGVAPIQETGPINAHRPPPPPPPAAAPGGSAQRKPVGFEKEYGHVL
ncbi:type II and III secretion system protein family protein [Sphingomonas sp. SM33]|uniref:Type II and III secretion system protein family protein n=1 Tax=Sphingomonas telluris TaxID=2907998 RepID=A0ABS9VJU1_9SPHN|nr:type II and III secretion system protein family protein [Sphingomonas telluris]MCH8614764.1 type II and III secretion system protein family protein [Sphingomonas telluris]